MLAGFSDGGLDARHGKSIYKFSITKGDAI
jgi:hypothetical protein